MTTVEDDVSSRLISVNGFSFMTILTPINKKTDFGYVANNFFFSSNWWGVMVREND